MDTLLKRLRACLALLVLLACGTADQSPDAESVGETTTALPYDGLTASVAYDGLTAAISVTPPIDANNPAGKYTLTATVTGGAGPFYYRWFQRWCQDAAVPNNCPATYQKNSFTTQSMTVSTLSVDIKNDFIVEVRRQPEDRATVAKTTIWGPKPRPEPPPSRVNFICGMGTAVSSYVFDKNAGLCNFGSPSATCYRRNPCTGVREYYAGP